MAGTISSAVQIILCHDDGHPVRAAADADDGQPLSHLPSTAACTEAAVCDDVIARQCDAVAVRVADVEWGRMVPGAPRLGAALVGTWVRDQRCSQFSASGCLCHGDTTHLGSILFCTVRPVGTVVHRVRRQIKCLIICPCNLQNILSSSLVF